MSKELTSSPALVGEVMMDAHEAAEYLKVNVQTLRRLARDNEIPSFKVGGAWRFKRSTLDAWVSRRQDRGSSPTILLVDDDELVRGVLERILRDCGFEVAVCESGQEALLYLERHAPQLLIIDLMMPGMDGVETLRAVRARFDFLPVILVTGYPDSDLLAQALQYSPFALLPKPLRTSQLLEAVKWAVGGEKLPAALR
ncbi:response regulator [bacterium]|nr:response regulator [bacterium]